MPTLRKMLWMGSLLGRILRVWSLWDRAELCEHQETSELGNWMKWEVDRLDCLTRDEMVGDEGYQGSAEAKLESETHIVRW